MIMRDHGTLIRTIIQLVPIIVPWRDRTSLPEVFCKKGVFVFSCEFCEICKSTFSYRTPPVAASAENAIHWKWLQATTGGQDYYEL